MGALSGVPTFTLPASILAGGGVTAPIHMELSPAHHESLQAALYVGRSNGRGCRFRYQRICSIALENYQPRSFMIHMNHINR